MINLHCHNRKTTFFHAQTDLKKVKKSEWSQNVHRLKRFGMSPRCCGKVRRKIKSPNIQISISLYVYIIYSCNS